MTHFVLSPCIVKDINGDFVDEMETLDNYNRLLGFAGRWLSLRFLIHERSLYKQLWAYLPPLCDQSLAGFFASNIMPKFQSLISDGDVVWEEPCENAFKSEGYICVDQDECDLIACCIEQAAASDILMFVGLINSSVKSPIIIEINNNPVTLNLLNDPYKCEEDFLNKIIEMKDSNKMCIFPCAEICEYFIEKAKNEKTTASYQLCADVIAKRNGYSKLAYDARRYKPDVPCYISRNKDYYVSLDFLHGTFEVFDARNASYIGEYGFDGKLITAKTSDPNTHKFYK